MYISKGTFLKIVYFGYNHRWRIQLHRFKENNIFSFLNEVF